MDNCENCGKLFTPGTHSAIYCETCVEHNLPCISMEETRKNVDTDVVDGPSKIGSCLICKSPRVTYNPAIHTLYCHGCETAFQRDGFKKERTLLADWNKADRG